MSLVYSDVLFVNSRLDLDWEDNVNKIRRVSAPDKMRTIEKLKGSIV
ncbi:hypothetical protein VCR26J2_420108 [Vibrio coralliirubri]|nr:hypothetical protein VCR6J2_380105 [Vibrio coralliirubri]CDT37333.1 hypothetical protein VCR1J2_450006 [Vibrio coralliirubri]CDT86199.1 hypothetical protein VCR26J2_420108 [Vibrio coralliirubri]CDT91438.1 hypothetical protein VCR8J2_450005 [Vibrio coralliirubri]